MFLGIEGRRVDLDVVRILEGHIVSQSNGQCIAGEMAVVGRMLVETADAAAGEDHIVRVHHVKGAVLKSDDRAVADIVLFDDVDHGRELHQSDVRQLPDPGQKLARDLLSGDVVVEQDPLVESVGREEELPLRVLFEFDTVGYQVVDDVLRGADHDADRLFVVLIMSRFHGVFKIAFIIGIVLEHADAALSEVRVRAFEVRFGNEQDVLVLRALQRAVKAGTTAANNEDICFDHTHLPPVSVTFQTHYSTPDPG